MIKIANVKEDNITTEVFGGKAFGLSLLYKNGCLILNTLAIQATANVNDIDCQNFQEELLIKLEEFSNNGIYDLAVRSSCTLEDDFNNSMAGHFDSFLGIMSIEDVLENIRKIINGLQKYNDKGGRMGIVIQNRVNAEYSGVLFSSDPISYSKKQMIISYTNGIGDKLVSGEVSGIDALVTLSDEKFEMDGDVKFSLRSHLLFLAEKSKQLEYSLNYPIDIEWAIVGSDIYFLQCRPLTSITGVQTAFLADNKKNIALIPKQLVSHDKIQLRLTAQENNTFISNAYIYTRNECNVNNVKPDIPKSEYCKGYSVVITYPQHLSNKVIRSFVGDKTKVFESITDCCRYGIRSFPKYDSINSCLENYSELLSNEYWISTTIIQEIFDPLYTGVIRRISEGFIIEITRGHFLTKGVVPTSQYIVSKEAAILEKAEVKQQMWLKIIEGHVVHCVCNDGEESLVTINNNEIKNILERFKHILKKDSNVVEFGLLKPPQCSLEPYLIDFVDDNSPINISSSDIKSGVISYGSIEGKPVVIEKVNVDSLNEHFHNVSVNSPLNNEKVIFICQNPELALLNLLDKYDNHNIGFVFQECAIGAHLAVVLREKGIPAIKVPGSFNVVSGKEFCSIDAKTTGLLPEERLKYE